MSKNYLKTLISVVIPAFNEEKFLPSCLESLKNQDFKGFEIIVVDNNSTDKTAEMAKKFGAILVREKRQGVAFARQRGFLEARGEIITTTDADTILPKNWLSKIFEEFEKDENLVAFGGSATLYSGPILARLASNFLLYLFLLLDKFFSGGWNLMGCNFTVRKDAFLKIGGFNLNLKLNEDIEISQRLIKVGKVILDPNFKVKTSGRRYRHGLIFGLIDYVPSTFSRWIFRKYDKFQKFSPVRKEESLIGKFSFPIISLFVFLFFLFHLSTPKMVLAKNLIKKDLNKAVFTERRIKNGIKNDFGKLKNFKLKHNGKRNFFDLRRWAK